MSFGGDILSGLIGLLGAALGVYGAYYVMKEQLKAQNEQYRKDKIDNIFFNLLGLFQNVQKELNTREFIDSTKKYINQVKNDRIEKYFTNQFSKAKIQFIKDIEIFNNKTDNYYKHYCSNVIEELNRGLDIGRYETCIKQINEEVKTHSNTDYLKYFNKYLKNIGDFQKKYYARKSLYKCELKESDIKDIIKNVFTNDSRESGNYFRALYRCLKYIMDSDLKMEDKKFYSGVLRGVLSSKEMLLVFYNCMYFKKGEKFKELLEKEEKGKRIDFFGDKNDLENLTEGYDLPFFSKEDLLFFGNRYAKIRGTHKRKLEVLFICYFYNFC
ncbi:CRISPR-associated protein Cas5/CasD and we view the families that share this region as being Cas5 [Lactococcus lactis subsp. lactis]|nr:CRISPR-associated protein Cas5/CasD and we view the families that share this region as being Cas5 [Lactococcus lactis subsp. lactis]